MARNLASFWDELVACEGDLGRLLDLIAHRAAEVVGDAAVLTTLSADGAVLQPVAVFHPDPDVQDFMREVLASGPYLVGEGLAGQVAMTRSPAMLSGLRPDTMRTVVAPVSRPFVERHPIDALLVVPMVAFGDVVGTLGVARIGSTVSYSDEDVMVLEALAERAALALAAATSGPGLIGAADYEAIFRHSIDGVLFTMPDGRVLAANPAACEILRLPESEICRRGRGGLVVSDDPRVARAVVQRALSGRVRAEVPMRRGDGEVFTAEIASTIFTTDDGELRACVILRDVSEQVALRQELQDTTTELARLAEEDDLTGLRNRRGFVAAAERILAFADRERSPVQLVYADLDGLKAINDTHGHARGDAVLAALGSAIAGETRAVDAAGRLGGDEFVLLLYGAGEADADAVVARITPAFDDGLQDIGPVTFSVGRAGREPGATVTLDALIREADRRMYDDKRRKRRAGR